MGTVSVAKPPKATSSVFQKLMVVKKVIRKVNVVMIPVAETSLINETTNVLLAVSAERETKAATSTTTGMLSGLSGMSFTHNSSYRHHFQHNYPDRCGNRLHHCLQRSLTNDQHGPTAAGFTRILEASGHVAKRDFKLSERVTTLTLPGQGDKEYPQRTDCTKRVPQCMTKTITTTVQGPRITLKAATKT
ncbi:hypothetical protein ACHAPA_010312 [Fusarium lateritium]